MLCLDFPQAGLKWFNTQVLIHFQRKCKVIATILRKITFINKWLSYLGGGHQLGSEASGAVCTAWGVTTLLIHLLCLTKSSPCFCCISRRVSESIRCLPMHGPSARDSEFLQEAIFLPLSGLPTNYWPHGGLKCGMIKSACVHLSLSIPNLLSLTLFSSMKLRKWLLKLTFLAAHL